MTSHSETAQFNWMYRALNVSYVTPITVQNTLPPPPPTFFINSTAILKREHRGGSVYQSRGTVCTCYIPIDTVKYPTVYWNTDMMYRFIIRNILLVNFVLKIIKTTTPCSSGTPCITSRNVHQDSSLPSHDVVWICMSVSKFWSNFMFPFPALSTNWSWGQ